MTSQLWPVSGPVKQLLTIQDVADVLEVSVASVQHLVDTGRLPPGLAVGDVLGWLGADVAAYLQQLDAKGGKS